jgi:hypothetical protein
MSTWGNPYTEHNRRSQIADLNRERVLRQKKEREFMRGLQDKYQMGNMEEVEARIDEMNKIKLLDIRAAQRPRSVTPRVVAERPPIATVGRIDDGIRCFHPTHGGATIWTGEADGCIGIRNGTDLSLAYRIDKTDGVFVDVITQSSAQHMWVGMSDGTIRIYDPLVFILLFEGKKHEKAVTAITETFDGKMFTGSVDGSVVKWDTEAHEFECMMELPPCESAVRSLACYGYNLFIACDSPVIRCADAETGLDTRVFEGHEGTVTTIAVTNGFLWSGSADSTIIVWTIDDAAQVATLTEHRCGVTDLMADDVGHTVWSTDESGQIHVWHSQPEQGFALVRSYVPDGAGAPMRLIKGLVAVDASKMWSLGGNGTNFVWHSATNRVERSARQAIVAMEHIIDQDGRELERWSAIIANLKAVAARLRQAMSAHLCESTERIEAQERFFRWLRFARLRVWRKRLPYAANALENAAQSDLSARYLSTWTRFVEAAQRKRHHAKIADVLGRNRRNELLTAYVTKAANFFRFARAKQLTRARARFLVSAHDRRAMGTAFQAWANFLAGRRRHRKRLQMAAALCASVDRAMLSSYFVAWVGSVRRRLLQSNASQRSIACAGVMLRAGPIAAAYFRWLAATKAARVAKRRSRIATVVSRRSSRLTLARSFLKWQRWAIDQNVAATSRGLTTLRESSVALQSKLDAVEHITGRQHLAEEVQRLIDQTRANIEAKKARYEQLGEECEDVVRQTELHRSGQQQETAKSIAEQVDDLIAMLKAKLINVHHDYALTRKVVEKAKNVNASRLFLESHQAVKRIVVQLTGQGYLGSEDVWPLTEAKVKSMPKHHAESVLTAIKSMIVTFDIMTPEDRSKLQTDNEIAINAHWLRTFADACVALRKKALGKAMYRVK